MNQIERLSGMIRNSSRIVFFTGAGISTESGIPDFRSPGGFWTKNKPIMFADFLASAEMRRESWRRRLAAQAEFGDAQPNRGHMAIARLVLDGRASSVITQNIDGLHQKSGIPDHQVIELHGNNNYAVCLRCARRFELAPILADFAATGEPPDCNSCGGHLKTATISFGQSMPEDAMRRARIETDDCDLFVVVGSSLVVDPAASFPFVAKRAGAQVVILNREPTGLDGLADLNVRAEAGQALAQALGET